MTVQTFPVESVPISKLVPWSKNPRKSHNVAAIARSIQEHGYLSPIVVQARTYRILAGHGRYEACKLLRMDTVPVIVADVDDTKATQYTIADNELTDQSQWDNGLLVRILQDLTSQGADLAMTAIDGDTIEKLLRSTGESRDDDPAGEPPAKPQTARGDLWRLGEHAVICGDSENTSDVQRLTGGRAKAQCVFTDPPYGVAYEGATGRVANDAEAGAVLERLLFNAFTELLPVTQPTAAWYIWHASSTRDVFVNAMRRAGLQEAQYLIWAKASFVLGHADYHWSHEPCFYAHRAGSAADFFGNRAQSTVWRIAQRTERQDETVLGPGVLITDDSGASIAITRPTKAKKIRAHRLRQGQSLQVVDHAGGGTIWEVARVEASQHPTQKPTELAITALENSTRRGDIVIDPFLGGGCTLLGAERTGRVCLGIDIEPAWVDLAVDRWQRMTGKRAENLTRPGVTIA